MEQATKRPRRLKLSLFSQALFYSAFNLILFLFFLCCFNILLSTAVTRAAVPNLLEKTLLLTYAPECSPINNVAERALRKSLALSIEKQTRSTFARINEGAYEGPDLPMSTRVVGDYEAYSAKVITLDAVKFTEGADGLFRPVSSSDSTTAATGGPDGPGLRCTVSEESLKRVGVDVLQLVACPLVSAEDVKQALAVDPCVASVELDQQLTVDAFGIGEIHGDAEWKPQFSGKERPDGLEARSSTPHSLSAHGADTRIIREESDLERKPQAEPSKKSNGASAEDDVHESETHSHRTKNSPLRSKPVQSSTVANQNHEVYNSSSEIYRTRSTPREDGRNGKENISSGAGVAVAADAFGILTTSATVDAFTTPDAPEPASVSATTGVSAAVERSPSLPERDVQSRASTKVSSTDTEMHRAAWRTFVSRSQDFIHAQKDNPDTLPVRREAAEAEVPPLSLEASAITAPALPEEAPQREDVHRHGDFPSSNGDFFFLRALISSSQPKAGSPVQAMQTDALPEIFSPASQKFAPPHEVISPHTAVSAKADEEAKQKAQTTVPAPKAAAVGASAAEVPSITTEQKRLPSRRVPLQAGRSDDLDASYWRSKSGFHTRAYELASCQKNRVIAVIDTGITYSHPALAPNVWVNKGEIPGNGIDDDRNGYVDDVHGYNFRDGTGDPIDDHGHGTHVAGIIGALDHVSEQGRPYAYKRSQPLSEDLGDEMQQKLEEQQHEQQKQEQQGEYTKGQQQLREDQQQLKGEDQQQDQEKQQRTQQQSTQQEQEPQRRKRQRRVSPWEDQPQRVRAQQGVCGETSIAGLKFMGASGNGATSDAIKALNYAVQMNMKLSCNSWGGPSWSEALVVALEAADETGHLFIAAAGNQGKNTDEIPHYPASYQLPNVISVAATTIDDELAPFSNRGKRTVDVAAPGVKIRSTFPPDSYKELSGTSMATPVVAGLAAMLMSLPYDNTKQIKDAILKGVDKIPAVAGLVKSGGRINAEKSVAWLVNELDLDVDMILQRKQMNFRLPPFYALLDDAIRHLTTDDRQRTGGRENKSNEEVLNEGGGFTVYSRAVDTEEGEKAERVKERHEDHQEKSGEEAREKRETSLSKSKISSEMSRNIRKDIEQAEDEIEGAERGKLVLRLLKQNCVTNCLPLASK